MNRENFTHQKNRIPVKRYNGIEKLESGRMSIKSKRSLEELERWIAEKPGARRKLIEGKRG